MTVYLLVNIAVYLLIFAGASEAIQHLIADGELLDPFDMAACIGSASMLAVSLYLLFT